MTMDQNNELREIKQCGADWEGHRCVLPEGHLEEHQSVIHLPADVGRMIDEHITALDATEHRLRITRRWLFGAVAINVLAAIYNVFGILF